MVSGSPHVSNSFVSPYRNSFVSQSCWWCPALRMSPISPYSNSFVSQSGWWCLALRMSPIDLFPLQQFICLPVWLVVSGSPFVSPYHNSIVSQSGWWCPALRMSPIHLFPLVVIQLSHTCGFLDVVSQSGGFELFSRSFADVVSLLSPRCLPDVVSQLSPRCSS